MLLNLARDRLNRRRHRLLPLLLGLMVLAQTALAWHEHGAVTPNDSDCDICLQLSSHSAVTVSKPALPDLIPASAQQPVHKALRGSRYTLTPQSRGPPSH